MEKIFRFKQFAVQQDQCAMKIGTDGVLLGAWAGLGHRPGSILDIGAGTGLLALMMAQRSKAELIDAVEIEPSAYVQCVDNFENSPWSDRLFCYHADFDGFAEEMEGETYELILSNPPFFETSEKNKSLSPERQKARFTDSLSYSGLIKGAVRLLSEQGRLAVIVPFWKNEAVVELAAAEGLNLQRETHVKGRPGAAFKRSLLQFGFEKMPLENNALTIELERHHYTKAYSELTKAFYLKM